LGVLISLSILNVSCSSSSQSKSELKSKSEEDSSELKNKVVPSRLKKKVTILNADPSKKPLKNTFKDVTALIGLSGVKAAHMYAVDWNGDGAVDLVTLPDYYSVPLFYSWSKKKKKFLIAKKDLFKQAIRASFLVFADFNKDGKLDLIAATLNQKTELNKYPLRLFIAKGSKKRGFSYQEKVGAFPEMVMPTSSLSLIDVNLDGLIDVYVGNWFDNTKKVPRPAPDRIFLGTEDGLKWRDGSYLLEGELTYNRDLEVYPNAAPTYGTSVCDIDDNGYADILTASSSGRSNKVWLNFEDRKNKDRILIDSASKIGLSSDKEGSFDKRGGGNSFYQLCTDYNNDGFLDVATGELIHSYDPETRDRSAIMTGKGPSSPPSFIRTEYHKDDGSGSWSQGDRRAIWSDINFDGVIDLIVENSGFPPKSRLIVFEQGSDHSFGDRARDFGVDVMNPSGSVVMDFDQDGRLDLLVGQVSIRNSTIGPKIYAYENNFEWNRKRVVKVVLRGKKANYHGIGATVTLKTNKSKYKRVVDFSYGGLSSQNQEGLWFGMGDQEAPLSIEVRWPLVKKDRLGRSYPLRRVYKISNLSFKKKVSLILLESGRFLFE
jgi:hypothetical protein